MYDQLTIFFIYFTNSSQLLPTCDIPENRVIQDRDPRDLHEPLDGVLVVDGGQLGGGGE